VTKDERNVYLALGGVAVGWTVVAHFLFRPEPPAPPMPNAPNGDTWTEKFSPLALKNSTAYRACVSVPWPFSPSDETVIAKAEAAGFRLVRVADDRPGDWPAVDCKHFVEATWTKADETMSIPSVIKHVWELST
jgi:hypothetical protein